MAPLMLRLAWHCSGTWCKTALNGGSDGATMRFKPECDHGGNAGLGIARDLLEPIKAKHPNVSYADLYILAGVVAVEEMGGPKVRFQSLSIFSYPVYPCHSWSLFFVRQFVYFRMSKTFVYHFVHILCFVYLFQLCMSIYVHFCQLLSTFVTFC